MFMLNSRVTCWLMATACIGLQGCDTLEDAAYRPQLIRSDDRQSTVEASDVKSCKSDAQRTAKDPYSSHAVAVFRKCLIDKGYMLAS